MEQKIALLSLADYSDQIGQTVEETLRLIGNIEKIIEPGNRVLIKPNLVNDKNGESGNVTHSSLVGSVIRICHDLGASEILVGDGSGDVDTPQAYVGSGAKQVVDQLSSAGIPVKFVDLNYDKNPKTGEYDEVNLKEVGLNRNFTYRVAHSVLASDTIISLPKLKTHTFTGITVALKNFIGIAPGGYYGIPKRRGRVEVLPHGPYDVSPVIQQTILDLDRIALGRYPDSPQERKYLAIVDGVTAGAYHGMVAGASYPPEGIPIWRPVKVGAIIAGTDPVAVDTVSARVMCYCPEKIDLIVRAASLGLGSMNDIQIVGDKVEDVRHFVPPPYAFLHIADKTISGVRGKIYRQALRKAVRPILGPVWKRYKHIKHQLGKHF